MKKKKQSYAMDVVDTLKKEGNFATANIGVGDVIFLLEDDENEIKRLNGVISSMRRSTKKFAIPMMEDWIRVTNQYGDDDEEELKSFCADMGIDLEKEREKIYDKKGGAK